MKLEQFFCWLTDGYDPPEEMFATDAVKAAEAFHKRNYFKWALKEKATISVIDTKENKWTVNTERIVMPVYVGKLNEEK